ncbi:MAG TPA: hypothetical protein VFQ51_11465, partial [Vicinamibacteria bacterium]|nr:hypothetical protein [Vicinamibacteria bacterium]
RSVTESEVRGNDVARAGAETANRYDGVELSTSSNDNLVTQNVCRLGPRTRSDITVGPGCLRNRVFGNTSVPWAAASAEQR